ncbi:MAG TPA: biotin/lipoyl-containing protein [Victivallales bacterium]|nr:biotin/lipoyl-containing protein [Victivallales bacterium]
MKKIKFMDTSFRDGFQSCFGARIKTEDFLPALKVAVDSGTVNFEIGGGARFQSLYFYCQEDAFDMMDKCREVVGSDINLQTLARGANVVGLVSQSRDIIELHAKMFKKHGVDTIRNFDALNDVRNLKYSGHKISENGLKHQITITLMGLPPGIGKVYEHSPEYYVETFKKILKANIPFDSLCLKDASGTTCPQIVYKTAKGIKKLLPEGVELQFHTHDTAGMAIACNMAAIEGGADIIDLAMQPCSGGTGQADILGMWHKLKDTDYTLDIDYLKIMQAEEAFIEHMDKYFLPPEAREINPFIIFSPMPGGALTANTQMMRDNNCLNLFPKVIKEMQEVVERGGFGTSVTPVSQFYFQQAFSNVTQGKWANITEPYGKMVLGYFGQTPAEPDPEIVKMASEQLNLPPTKEDVHDLNDKNPKLGIEYARKQLLKNNLPVTDENIFIAAACEIKGIDFLKGDKPMGIRYKKDVVERASLRAQEEEDKKKKEDEIYYNVTIEGKTKKYVQILSGLASDAQYPIKLIHEKVTGTSGKSGYEVRSPMPGSVFKVLVTEGQIVERGETVIILEAMKMESKIVAEKPGKVIEILIEKGQTVESNELMLLLQKIEDK